VSHALQLDFYCEDPDGPYVAKNVGFIACGRNHQISLLDKNGEEGDYEDLSYTCSIGSSFAADGTQLVPLATLSTGSNWNVYQTYCYSNTTILVNPAVPVTAPPTEENTEPPMTPEPTLPKESTTSQPSKKTDPPEPSSSSSSTAAIAGGAIAGIVVLSAAFYFLLRTYKRSNPSDEQPHALSKTFDSSVNFAPPSPSSPKKPMEPNPSGHPSSPTLTSATFGSSPGALSSPVSPPTASYSDEDQLCSQPPYMPGFKDQVHGESTIFRPTNYGRASTGQQVWEAEVPVTATALPLDYQSVSTATSHRSQQLEP